MKKHSLQLMLALALMIGTILVTSSCTSLFSAKIVDADIVIKDCTNSSSNYLQTPFYTKLFEYGEKLYFHQREYKLIKFEDGDTKIIFNDKNANFVAISNGYAYYLESKTQYLEYDLMCLDLETGEKNCVMEDAHRVVCGTTDNKLYAPMIESGNTVYYPITERTTGEPTVETPFWCEYNGKRYELKEETGKDIVVLVENGIEYSVDEINNNHTDSKNLLPTENGIVVHCEEQQKLLYFIDGETGVVTELFSAECLTSKSSANVYDDMVYFSVKRYEKLGESKLGMLEYENDTISGTYKIDTRTGAAEKIDDSFYDGIYIFDSTGFYATTESGGVYKFSFDGKLLQTIAK